MDTTNLSLKSTQTLSGHKERVWSVAWNPSGDLLASCGGDKAIKIWAKKEDGTFECKATFGDQHTRTIRSICWSPDGQLLASAGFDSQICIWLKKGDTFDFVAVMDGHENEIKSVCWDAQGEYLASCGRDKTIWVWDKDEGYEYSCNSILNGHSQDIKKVKWIPGKLLLASASYDDTIKIWAPEDDDWECISTLKGHESTVWDIDFTKDGKFLASASDDTTIKVWARDDDDDDDKVAYSLVSTLQGYHTRTVYSCSWNADGNLLVTGGADNKICLFVKEGDSSGDSLPSVNVVDTKENAHYTDINCVAFHPTENIFASCGDDNIIKIWKIEE